MATTLLSHVEFLKLYNTLHNSYDKVIDQKDLIICYNYEEAIQQYVIDNMIQLLNTPNSDEIELRILSPDGWNEAHFEELLAEALA